MRFVHRLVRCPLLAARPNRALWIWLGLWLLAVPAGRAMEIEEGRALFLSGRYPECVAAAHAEYKERSYSEQWRPLLVDALWTVGRYAEARAALAPYARGEIAGEYRRAEAAQLLERLPERDR